MMLDDRYELSNKLGASHASGVIATDHQSGESVVVKELVLGRLSSWKDLDLFWRETSALEQLDHPGVPRFVDSFQPDDGDGEPRFYLVQEYVAGTSLADLIDESARQGQTFDADALRDISRQCLEILVYLQSFSPPVLHRDIKPANIVIRSDGTVALISFGSVSVILHGTTGGSTVVGTSGYMAPEQLVGKAVPSSDLYALGASLVHAATGIHPADLPMERMKLRWRDRTTIADQRFLDFVDHLVAPIAARRPQNAATALRTLSGGTGGALTRPNDMLATRPADTDIVLQRSTRRLRIVFPERHRLPVAPGRLGFIGAASLAITAVLGSIHVPQRTLVLLGVLSCVLVLGALGLVLYKRQLKDPMLELDRDRGYRLRCAQSHGKLKAGQLSEIIGPDLGYGTRDDSFFLATRKETYELANGCTRAEQEWLADEVADFLRTSIR